MAFRRSTVRSRSAPPSSPRLARASIGIAVALYVGAGLAVQWRLNRRLASDAAIFLDAARRAFAGANPYAPFSIGSSFVYPPSALAFFLPFAELPGRLAPAVWGAAGVVLYGAALALLFQRSGALAGGTPGRAAAFALAAAYAPFLESASIGQSNALVLFGLVLFLVGLEDPRWRRIGDAGLAVAISIKMTPVVLLALPAARRDVPRLARVLAALSALAVLSVVLFPVRLWSDFAGVFPKLFTPYVSLLNHAPGPTAGWIFWKAGLDPAWGLLAGRVFAPCLLLAWLGVVLVRRTAPPLPVALLGVVTMTLGSGLVWYHHLVYLAPVFALVLARFARPRPGVAFAAAAALALVQADRLVELDLRWPPVASVAGYLLLCGAAFAVATGTSRADGASDAVAADGPSSGT